MLTVRRSYQAYLLRLWQVRQGGVLTWRASLERAHTGERKGFDSLGDLFAYLCAQTQAAPDANGMEGVQGEGNDADRD
jgi:hypothetical protein